MKSRLVIALSWIFVFLLGGVAGAISHYLYRETVKPVVVPAPPPKPGSLVDKMARELSLDNEQKESLRTIFSQSRQRYKALGQQYMPQFETIRKETDDQIREMLRPDQRAKFDDFLKKAYASFQGKRQGQQGPPKPR